MPAEPVGLPVEPVSGSDEVFAGKRILVVDDDVRNVFALTSALEGRGMEVRYAENGRDALEALEADEGGGAEVAFSDGTVLTVAPHPREEAWQLQGAGGLEGLVYRCPAGGGRPWRA